jgi:hypothetical protein
MTVSERMRIMVWPLLLGLLLPVTGWDAVKALHPGTQIRIVRTGGRELSGQFQAADDSQIGAGMGGRSTVVPALLFPAIGAATGRLTGQRELVIVYQDRVP